MNEKDNIIIKNINRFCKEIISFVENFEYDDFDLDLKTNKACILNLEQIGENAKKLSIDFKEKHKNIPWQAMADFRNIVAHNYFGLNLDDVWDIVMKDIPELLEFTESILKMSN